MKDREPNSFRRYLAELRDKGFTDPLHRTTPHFPPMTGKFMKDPVTGEPRFVCNGVTLLKGDTQVDVFPNDDGGCEVRARHPKTGALYRSVYNGTEPIEGLDEKVEQLEAFLFGRQRIDKR